jgi:hypothetical protein
LKLKKPKSLKGIMSQIVFLMFKISGGGNLPFEPNKIKNRLNKEGEYQYLE